MVTRDALVSSIFGIGDPEKLKRLIFSSKNESTLTKTKKTNEHTLGKAWLLIENNSKLLKTKSFSNFFAYSFGLTPSSGYSSFPGHAFLVIQYLDKQAEFGIHYRIFQSYLGEFCLRDCLKKNNNGLNHSKFMVFLKGLQDCILSDTWTNALETFYIKYFNVKKGFAIGNTNPCKGGDFGIEWGITSMDDILIQNEKFESFKQSPDFPKIEAWH